jgi:hypothetical protein
MRGYYLVQKCACDQKARSLFQIERFVAGFAKISRNAREVKVNSVGLGDRIDPVQISNSLVLNQGRNGTLCDRTPHSPQQIAIRDRFFHF